MLKSITLKAVIVGILFACSAPQAETIDTRIGKLEFTHDFANGYPTNATVEKLYDELDFQRASQAYLWALPIVSMAQWQHEHMVTLGAKSARSYS